MSANESPDDNIKQSADDADGCEGTTTTPERRAVWLATAVASVYAMSLPLLVAIHTVTTINLVDLSTIPQGWFILYSAGVATSVVFALGIQKFFEGVIGGS